MADWVLLPLKPLSEAKSRLSPVLGLADREDLMRAMVADVIVACRAARRVDRIAVITKDDEWRATAEDMGCLVLQEDGSLGYTAAAERGCALLADRGDVRHVAVLPGDLPLINPQEVDRVISSLAGGARCVIVPSRDGLGTNCMAQALPLTVPLRYGPQSFSRHLSLAHAAGITTSVLRLPGIGHDIDLPDDLLDLDGQAQGTATAALLSRLRGHFSYRHPRRSA